MRNIICIIHEIITEINYRNIVCHIHEIITEIPLLVLKILYHFSSVLKSIIN
jgi:hypothetical protein